MFFYTHLHFLLLYLILVCLKMFLCLNYLIPNLSLPVFISIMRALLFILKSLCLHLSLHFCSFFSLIDRNSQLSTDYEEDMKLVSVRVGECILT